MRLDSAASRLSNAEFLSTIFVDNVVHSLYKRAISGVCRSLFCFEPKKCATFFSEVNHEVVEDPRVVAWFAGRESFSLMTAVDEKRPAFAFVKPGKSLNRNESGQR